MKCGTRIGVVRSEAEEEMDEPKYVVRRITPVEAERLQGFPEVVYLNTDIINRDEAVAFALVNGDIFAKPDTGQLFRTRGPGGIRLNTPIEIDGSNCNGYKVFSLHAKGKKWQIKKHRAIWISVHGIPSEGMVIDHINNDKTDNRIANLQLLTSEGNSTKASIDGCYLCGNDNPQTKLPVEMRAVVYREYLAGAGTYQQLAEKYGVSKSRIAQIVQNKGYTDVEFKGKPAPDTARYKALGNSMTVNVMRWIAKRILMVENGEL